MPSPFPGMDPFIEACGLWEDFHPKLIGEIERTLDGLVPERYFVSLAARNYIAIAGAEGKDFHPFIPDVGVSSAMGRPSPKSGAVAEAAPKSGAIGMQAFVAEPFRETFIEIIEGDAERHLVTSIKVLSPSNKRPARKGENSISVSDRSCCWVPLISWNLIYFGADSVCR